MAKAGMKMIKIHQGDEILKFNKNILIFMNN